MTLLDMQRAFSRILTDQDFQRAFVAREEDALRTYELSDRELHSLRGLMWDRVATHTRNLAHGRLELALKTIPLTSRLLHGQLHRFLARFCAEYPPVPTGAGQASIESARLCEFILHLLDEGSLTPYWAKDIVTFEMTRWSLGDSQEAWDSHVRTVALNHGPAPDDLAMLSLVPVHGPHARLAEFRHDVVTLIPHIAAGEVPAAHPLDRPLRILFTKALGVPGAQAIKVNDATAALLSACDGRRTTAGVLDRVAEPLGRRRPAERAEMDLLALRALRKLRELNVIAFQNRAGE